MSALDAAPAWFVLLFFVVETGALVALFAGLVWWASWRERRRK